MAVGGGMTGQCWEEGVKFAAGGCGCYDCDSACQNLVGTLAAVGAALGTPFPDSMACKDYACAAVIGEINGDNSPCTLAANGEVGLLDECCRSAYQLFSEYSQ
jgi:hypothetical protein